MSDIRGVIEYITRECVNDKHVMVLSALSLDKAEELP